MLLTSDVTNLVRYKNDVTRRQEMRHKMSLFVCVCNQVTRHWWFFRTFSVVLPSAVHFDTTCCTHWHCTHCDCHSLTVNDRMPKAKTKSKIRQVQSQSRTATADPGAAPCSCKNLCNRTEENARVPVCNVVRFVDHTPQAQWQCRCGTQRQRCTNRGGQVGSILSQELLGRITLLWHSSRSWWSWCRFRLVCSRRRGQ